MDEVEKDLNRDKEAFMANQSYLLGWIHGDINSIRQQCTTVEEFEKRLKELDALIRDRLAKLYKDN